jgi:hypothetical protein
MKNTFTILETFRASDGKVILFRGEQLSNFFKKTYEENFANMTPDEKQEAFQVEQEYGDLLTKMWKEPLQKVLNGSVWVLPNEPRNVIEEYEYALSIPKDEDMTEEEHNLKIERLRLYKELYEKQIT